MPIPASITIDARGLRCPLPVLRLRKIALQHPPGTLLKLTADDPAAARDIPAFAEEMGWVCTPAGNDRWTVTR